MNDLIRPAFYDAYHEIVPLTKKNGATISSDVVGRQFANPGDYFCKDRPLPKVGEGDYLALVERGRLRLCHGVELQCASAGGGSFGEWQNFCRRARAPAGKRNLVGRESCGMVEIGMGNEFSTAAYWQGDFDENGLRQWAEKLRAQLGARTVSLGLVFMSPKFFPHAQAALEILRVHARIPLLAGCSSTSLVAGSKEIENATGIVLALYSLPGAELKGFRFTQEQVEASGWRDILADGIWRRAQ